MQTLATLVSSVLVDRAGRKILLLLSSMGMTVCLAFLGYYFLVADGDDKAAAKSISWLPLVSVVLLIILFSIGLGPLPWMMSGEVLAPEIKSFGTAAAVVANWTCVALVTFFFQPLMSLISTAYTFWLFSAWCAFATVFILICVPETKGKSIDEVQNILAGRKPGHKMNGKVWSSKRSYLRLPFEYMHDMSKHARYFEKAKKCSDMSGHKDRQRIEFWCSKHYFFKGKHVVKVAKTVCMMCEKSLVPKNQICLFVSILYIYMGSCIVFYSYSYYLFCSEKI